MPDSPLPEEDPIAMLAEALGRYIESVADDVNICCRHEKDTVVRRSADLFHVRRRFRESPAVLRTLTANVQALPAYGKKCSLSQWLEERTCLPSVWQRPGLKDVLHRGVRREWPMVVHVWRSAEEKTLIVEIVMQRSRGSLPEHPLRFLAMLIGCHEDIMPESVAAAEEGTRSTHWMPPREFLLEVLEPGTAMYLGVKLGGR